MPLVATEQEQNQKLFVKYLPTIKKIEDLNSESQKALLTIVENLR